MIYRKLRTALAGVLLFAAVTAAAFSQVVVQKEDFDNYHLRIDAGWYYSDPSGNIHGSTTTDNGTAVDLQKDLGFTSYSTFQARRTGSSQERIISTSPPLPSTSPARRYSIEHSPFRGRHSTLD